MDKQLIGIDTKLLQLKSLKETPGNPQKMDDKTFSGMVQSMREKGWLLDSPTIWEKEDGNNQIISGHHRIRAAIQAGIIEAPCKVIKGITEEQAAILVLEANQRKGEFDDILLNDFVDDIVEKYNIDIDQIIEEIGIDEELLTGIIQDDKINEKELDEDIEIKKECPKCGYQWS